MRYDVNPGKETNAVVVYTDACNINNKWMGLPAGAGESNTIIVEISETWLSETDHTRIWQTSTVFRQG